MKELKKQLRKQIAQEKRRHDITELMTKSAALLEKLEQHPKFASARTVLLYYSLGDEVQTHDFVEKWHRQKTILLPVVKGDELELRIYAGRQNLKNGEAYHIEEPTAIENIRTSAKKRHSAGVAMLATGITFAVIFGITAIACFGTAGAFTSGSVMAVDELVLGAAAETADTFLNAIGDLALGAIAATGWCSAAVTAVFGWLTAAGASRMKAAKTLELYADTAEGFDWHKGLSLSMLADLTHKKKTKALKMLRKFIHKGWLSAWLDEKNDKLYLTAEDYRAAQENQPQPEPEKAPEQAGEVPLNLETTRRFAQVLEKEQGLMEDERAVEELQHMQKTTESICAWLEAHPESLPKARRFAEYYIPTTLKLLHTYNDVQSQQGGNAEAIRRDIAGILHTLNQAYDNLYDKLLSDVALDVSSEIAALQGMLANDGLAGEGLR